MDLFQNSVRFWRKPPLSVIFRGAEKIFPFVFDKKCFCRWKSSRGRSSPISDFTDRAWKSQKRTEWEMWRLKKSPTELKKTKNERNLKCEHWKNRRQSSKKPKTNGISNVNIEKKKTSLSDFADSDWKFQKRTEIQMRMPKYRISSAFLFSLFFIFLAIFLYRFRSSGSTLALVELLAASLANAEFLIKQAQRARLCKSYECGVSN